MTRNGLPSILKCHKDFFFEFFLFFLFSMDQEFYTFSKMNSIRTLIGRLIDMLSRIFKLVPDR